MPQQYRRHAANGAVTAFSWVSQKYITQGIDRSLPRRYYVDTGQSWGTRPGARKGNNAMSAWLDIITPLIRPIRSRRGRYLTARIHAEWILRLLVHQQQTV